MDFHVLRATLPRSPLAATQDVSYSLDSLGRSWRSPAAMEFDRQLKDGNMLGLAGSFPKSSGSCPPRKATHIGSPLEPEDSLSGVDLKQLSKPPLCNSVRSGDGLE